MSKDRNDGKFSSTGVSANEDIKIRNKMKKKTSYWRVVKVPVGLSKKMTNLGVAIAAKGFQFNLLLALHHSTT